ncbi:MAG: ribosomal protein L7/L12, partial [Comamonas testosteroni]|uniref:ribosomal protein L7/L12 n=1 Tax=Comamonas testosteroni TaxID=285 RepID=UPI003D10B9D2
MPGCAPGTSATCRWTAADARFNSHKHKEQLMATQIPPEILKHWQSGHKIEAIKQLREQSGLGLKETKDLLEASDDPDFVQHGAAEQTQA